MTTKKPPVGGFFVSMGRTRSPLAKCAERLLRNMHGTGFPGATNLVQDLSARLRLFANISCAGGTCSKSDPQFSLVALRNWV